MQAPDLVMAGWFRGPRSLVPMPGWWARDYVIQRASPSHCSPIRGQGEAAITSSFLCSNRAKLPSVSAVQCLVSLLRHNLYPRKANQPSRRERERLCRIQTIIVADVDYHSPLVQGGKVYPGQDQGAVLYSRSTRPLPKSILSANYCSTPRTSDSANCNLEGTGSRGGGWFTWVPGSLLVDNHRVTSRCLSDIHLEVYLQTMAGHVRNKLTARSLPVVRVASLTFPYKQQSYITHFTIIIYNIATTCISTNQWILYMYTLKATMMIIILCVCRSKFN